MTDDKNDKGSAPVDKDKTPPAQDVDDKVTVKDDVRTDDVKVEDTVTVSKEEFTDWQTKIVDLQEKVEKSEKEKVKMQRDQKFAQLKALNPKLAELNKNAVESTLDTVIITAKTIKGQFPSISDGEAKPAKKIEAGYRLLGSKEWITDNLS